MRGGYVLPVATGSLRRLSGNIALTVNSTVGTTLVLAGTLDNNVRSGFQSVSNSGLSDYTATFFVTPDTPGVSIVSASGHDYTATAVPEPGMLPFLSLASTAVIAVSRRKVG